MDQKNDINFRGTDEIVTQHILVTGLVQGVGFRPFIHRLALEHRLTGWVINTNEDVQIRITGPNAVIERFISDIRLKAPLASSVDGIKTETLLAEPFGDFTIRGSHNISGGITDISPDIAVCPECLQDMYSEGTRHHYPFVNCTNCGPRFTIIRDLPYDRPKTTMEPFRMCPECEREYYTITNRRFHAQPTACNICGPQYLLYEKESQGLTGTGKILDRISQILAGGGTLLMKGLGGMHLVCDALNPAAVGRLRMIKKRDDKPFAVMFRDMEAVRKVAEAGETEEGVLLSWQRPIVLLRKREEPQALLPEALNSGLNLVGAMLPYLPFHHLLFDHLKTNMIVMTSGNFSSEPILIDNDMALAQFSGRVDAVLLHEREIFNRTDDSVVRIMAGERRVFRRSRGFVPSPVAMRHDCDGIIAFGAELTNCFCIGKNRKAYLSQHMGDLQGLETLMFYEQTMERFLQLFRVSPSMLVTDLHPDYLSTRHAERFPVDHIIKVQHHHAHIAACMAEHGLDERVIGVALDGTGFGDDGHTWGGEFLVCDLSEYSRAAHFDYIPMPGGDLASEEPWRMAVAWLNKVYPGDEFFSKINLIPGIDIAKADMLIQMIKQGVNCPLTSGAGRLFDAVASLLGICHVARFHAEGPMRLESMVISGISESYPLQFDGVIRFDGMIRAIMDDILRQQDKRIIATKFHNTVIKAIFETVTRIRNTEYLSKVVLSGGVFQNRYLLEGVMRELEKRKFSVFTHRMVPANDGGIALGQLAIAAKKRSQLCV